MTVKETPESWRYILGEMCSEEMPSWTLLLHLYAGSDNALTAAQLAHRMNIPENGVVRLMNSMGKVVAEQTGWFNVPDCDDGWQIYFTRRLNENCEWVYSIKDKFLPILATI